MVAIHLYIGFAQRDEWSQWGSTYARHAQRFEAASDGIPCLILPYWQVRPDLMVRLDPRAVVMSGFARSFEEYDLADFEGITAWLDGSTVPTLALCGSHQLLGYHFNGALRGVDRVFDLPMRRLHPGEPVTNPDYHPDCFMERGFYPLELTEAGRGDPLFAGLGRPPFLYESHYCEIKSLPPGFELIASTPECRIQAIRHRERPLYGLQFHPEDYSDRFPDGRELLRNFFAFAAGAWSRPTQ